MKKIIINITVLCAVLLSLPQAPVRAQNSEVGACVGTMFYLGELNPTRLFAQPQLAAGLVYRYNISPRWAVKADFMFGKVSASDRLTNGGYSRNLSFFSPITEFSVVGELNFLRLYSSVGKNHFAPYIFAGLTVFSFDPQAQYKDGTVYELQSLGTEGQGLEGMPKKYSLTHFAIPFGIGFRFNIGKYVSLGAEWSMRYTFTDYLDDVGGRYYDNDLLRERRAIVEQDYPKVHTYRRVEDMLDDPEIDLVDIALPSLDHQDAALESLNSMIALNPKKLVSILA